MITEDLKQEMFRFLDNVRTSGVCNMFESPRILQDHYGLSKMEARDVTKDWMMNFSKKPVAN
jgi:hypothetical protein